MILVIFVFRYLIWIALISQTSSFYSWRKGGSAREAGFRLKVLSKSSELEGVEKLEERQIINLFCRLAEKRLLLNIPEAGLPEVVNCCHSGCDSCNYSRIFDELTSGRPKWIPFYNDLTFIDGRRHITKWNSIFADSIQRIDVIEFSNALKQLPIQACLGPPISLSDGEDLDINSVKFLWTKLCNINIQSHPLNDDRMSYNEVSPIFYNLSIDLLPVFFQIMPSLIKLTEKEYGCTYSEFKKIFG